MRALITNKIQTKQKQKTIKLNNFKSQKKTRIKNI